MKNQLIKEAIMRKLANALQGYAPGSGPGIPQGPEPTNVGPMSSPGSPPGISNPGPMNPPPPPPLPTNPGSMSPPGPGPMPTSPEMMSPPPPLPMPTPQAPLVAPQGYGQTMDQYPGVNMVQQAYQPEAAALAQYMQGLQQQQQMQGLGMQ